MQVMVDIEAYGDEAGRRIFQLSAVAFDMDGKINDAHELLQAEDCWFDGVVHWNTSYCSWPLPVNQDTIDWWADPQQTEGCIALLRGAAERAEPLRDAFARFSRFVKVRLGKKGGLWANPPTYDLSVTRKLHEAVCVPVPWHYRQERDTRTLMTLAKQLSPIKMPDLSDIGLVKHNGLHDAARQAVLVQAAYRALGLKAGDFARAEQAAASASG